MLQLIEILKLHMPTLLYPCRVLGIILLIVGIIILAMAIRGKLAKVNHPLPGAVWVLLVGAAFLVSNLLAIVAAILLWLILYIVFLIIDRKKEGTGSHLLPWPREKRGVRIGCDLAIFVFLFGVVFPYIGGGFAYQLFFTGRFEASELYRYHVEDYEGLICKEVPLVSDQGQTLAGYLYSYELDEPQRGVVVFGHGYGGGGHNPYLAGMDYFAAHGYYVFAYDATGTDASEGDSVIGLPHQIVDMDYAIRTVSELPETKDLPIALWGHSWGGYTVTHELAIHPEVKAVVCLSGFNYSMDLIYSWGCDKVGKFVTCYAYPYLALHQRLICGSLSSSTAVDAFEKSDANVMFVTAPNDPVVPPKYGFYLWEKMYNDNPRFVFRTVEGLIDKDAHNSVFTSKSYMEWRDEVDTSWLESLDYDYLLPENEERFIEDKKALLADPEVKYRRAHYIDEELFDEMLEFYEACGL